MASLQEASVAGSAATAACGLVSKRKRVYFEFAKREWETDPQFQLPLPVSALLGCTTVALSDPCHHCLEVSIFGSACMYD